MNQRPSSSTKSTIPPVPAANIDISTQDSGREVISLLNFDRNSEHVFITEVASIEALSRLGYEPSELSFKPIRMFVRRGCDESVTKLFFDKNQEKIKEIVEAAIKVREEILKEEEEKQNQEAMEVRRLRSSLKKEKDKITEMERKQNVMLRKLVVVQLRNLYVAQAGATAVERSNVKLLARVMEIEKKAAEYEKLPQIERIRMRSQGEAMKRREKIDQLDNNLRMGMERSGKSIQQQLDLKEMKIRERNENFTRKWEDEQQGKSDELRLNVKERSVRANSVLQARRESEEGRKQMLLEKIRIKEERSKSALNTEKTRIMKDMLKLRNKMNSRLKRARDLTDRNREEADKTRTSLDTLDAEVNQRIQERKHNVMLSLIEKEAERTKKAERAARTVKGQFYQKKRNFVLVTGDSDQLNSLEEEKQHIETEKQRIQRKYEVLKDKLIKQLNSLSNPNDTKALEQVQQILGMDEKQMKEIIESAKISINNDKDALSVNESKANDVEVSNKIIAPHAFHKPNNK